MCDDGVDDSHAAQRLIPDWFFTNNMIKELYTALCVDKNILYLNEYSGNVVFSCNDTVFLTYILMILILIILMKMILKLLFLSDFWLCILNLKNAKHLK